MNELSDRIIMLFKLISDSETQENERIAATKFIFNIIDDVESFGLFFSIFVQNSQDLTISMYAFSSLQFWYRKHWESLGCEDQFSYVQAIQSLLFELHPLAQQIKHFYKTISHNPIFVPQWNEVLQRCLNEIGKIDDEHLINANIQNMIMLSKLYIKADNFEEISRLFVYYCRIIGGKIGMDQGNLKAKLLSSIASIILKVYQHNLEDSPIILDFAMHHLAQICDEFLLYMKSFEINYSITEISTIQKISRWIYNALVLTHDNNDMISSKLRIEVLPELWRLAIFLKENNVNYRSIAMILRPYAIFGQPSFDFDTIYTLLGFISLQEDDCADFYENPPLYHFISFSISNSSWAMRHLSILILDKIISNSDPIQILELIGSFGITEETIRIYTLVARKYEIENELSKLLYDFLNRTLSICSQSHYLLAAALYFTSAMIPYLETQDLDVVYSFALTHINNEYQSISVNAIKVLKNLAKNGYLLTTDLIFPLITIFQQYHNVIILDLFLEIGIHYPEIFKMTSNIVGDVAYYLNSVIGDNSDNEIEYRMKLARSCLIYLNQVVNNFFDHDLHQMFHELFLSINNSISELDIFDCICNLTESLVIQSNDDYALTYFQQFLELISNSPQAHLFLDETPVISKVVAAFIFKHNETFRENNFGVSIYHYYMNSVHLQDIQILSSPYSFLGFASILSFILLYADTKINEEDIYSLSHFIKNYEHEDEVFNEIYQLGYYQMIASLIIGQNSNVPEELLFSYFSFIKKKFLPRNCDIILHRLAIQNLMTIINEQEILEIHNLLSQDAELFQVHISEEISIEDIRNTDHFIYMNQKISF